MPPHEFWKMWWAMADHVLLALRAEEACQFPRWKVDASCYEGVRSWAQHKTITNQTEERKKEITQHREERWAEELESAGYGKLDSTDIMNGTEDGKSDFTGLMDYSGHGKWSFTDVINHHFTMCWLKARAHRRRMASWKRHRLVGKPRFIVKKKRSLPTNVESGWDAESDDGWS